jgi:hypothetical protein
MITIYFIAWFLFKLYDNNNDNNDKSGSYKNLQNSIINVNYHLDMVMSFVQIIDSRMIGLIVFGFANLFTGIVNISIETHKVNDLNSFLILTLYMVLTLAFSFQSFYELNVEKFKKNKRQKDFKNVLDDYIII